MDRRFKAIYFAGIVAETLVRIPYDRQRRRIPKTDRRVTDTELILLAGLFFGMFLLPLAYSATRWFNFANYRLSPGGKIRAGSVGTLLLASAVVLFWRAHRDLGANWSPSLEINEQQTLTTGGIYGKIRHPMYASQWLWSLAQALLLQNWIVALAGFLVYIPFYFIRVAQEERMMLDHFGDAYRAYCARTGRVLPRLRAWRL